MTRVSIEKSVFHQKQWKFDKSESNEPEKQAATLNEQ